MLFLRLYSQLYLNECSLRNMIIRLVHQYKIWLTHKLVLRAFLLLRLRFSSTNILLGLLFIFLLLKLVCVDCIEEERATTCDWVPVLRPCRWTDSVFPVDLADCWFIVIEAIEYRKLFILFSWHSEFVWRNRQLWYSDFRCRWHCIRVTHWHTVLLQVDRWVIQFCEVESDNVVLWRSYSLYQVETRCVFYLLFCWRHCYILFSQWILWFWLGVY